ncbi:hypothetical protein GCM10009736_76120 [Actinomadura bangladeshensis]
MFWAVVRVAGIYVTCTNASYLHAADECRTHPIPELAEWPIIETAGGSTPRMAGFHQGSAGGAALAFIDASYGKDGSCPIIRGVTAAGER